MESRWVVFSWTREGKPMQWYKNLKGKGRGIVAKAGGEYFWSIELENGRGILSFVVDSGFEGTSKDAKRRVEEVFELVEEL